MALYKEKTEYKEPWVCFEYFDNSNIITTSNNLGPADDEIEDPDAVVIHNGHALYFIDENGDVIDPNGETDY